MNPQKLQSLEELYLATTGEEMQKYYRPPQGKYNENNLKQANEMFAAYFDFYPDNSFQLRKARLDKPKREYQNTFKNSTWSFNVATHHRNKQFWNKN